MPCSLGAQNDTSDILAVFHIDKKLCNNVLTKGNSNRIA